MADRQSPRRPFGPSSASSPTTSSPDVTAPSAVALNSGNPNSGISSSSEPSPSSSSSSSSSSTLHAAGAAAAPTVPQSIRNLGLPPGFLPNFAAGPVQAYSYNPSAVRAGQGQTGGDFRSSPSSTSTGEDRFEVPASFAELPVATDGRQQRQGQGGGMSMDPSKIPMFHKAVEEFFDSSFSFEPTLVPASQEGWQLFSQAFSLYKQRQIEQAASLLDLAINQFTGPHQVECCALLGCICLTYRRFGRSANLLGVALKYHSVVQSGFPLDQLHSKRAHALMGMARAQEAIEECGRAIAVRPDYPAHYLQRAVVYAKLRQYSKAVEDCTSGLGVTDEMILLLAFLNRRAIAFQAMEQFRKAIEDFTTAIALSPEHGAFYHNRSICHYELGEFNEGLLDAVRAQRLGVINEAESLHERSLSKELQRRCIGISSVIARLVRHSSDDRSVAVATILRERIDAIVHIALKIGGVEEKSCALRFSDLTKCLTLLAEFGAVDFEQLESGILQVEFPPLTDQECIVAYHLVENCPEYMPNGEVAARVYLLVRWVIRNGEIVHADCQNLKKVFQSMKQFRMHVVGLQRCLNQAFDNRHQETFHDGLLRLVDEQKKHCRVLYDLLLDRLEPFLSGVRHVIFVPDKILFRVPFGALLNKRDDRYFLESRSFSISASIQMIGVNAKQSQQDNCSSSSGGDKLPVFALVCGKAAHDGLGTPTLSHQGIRSLISTIGQREDRPTVALFGSSFVPSLVFRCCHSLCPRIIHFTAHGSQEDEKERDEMMSPILDFFGQTEALQDGSELKEEEKELFAEFCVHGRIQCSYGTGIRALELAELPLSGTRLVYLSSCNLGDGQLQAEGMLGMYRACWQAGCPTVICSLYPLIDLFGSNIAGRFYQALLVEKGGGENRDSCPVPIAEALRLSVLPLLREYRDLPAAWASMQTFGFGGMLRM